MKTLYVSDLDGTLLHSNDAVSPRTAEVVNRLIRRGVLFTFATARSLTSARVVAAPLEVEAPVIVYNGCFILDPRSRAELFSCGFSADETADVRRTLAASGLYPFCYAITGGRERVAWMPACENDGVRHYLGNRVGDKRFVRATGEDDLYGGAVFYFTVIGSRTDLLPAYEALCADPRLRCTLQQELYRPEYFLEIMPAQATKANAILMLRDLLGCGRIVSFGDAVNDLPMFRISDEAYAVENAVPALKEAATGILPANDEDGVARWLEENVLSCIP